MQAIQIQSISISKHCWNAASKHKISLPNNAIVVLVNKSLDSKMVVTLGSQLLWRHFSTLMFSSPLSNPFPKPTRWLTMYMNLFCTSTIESPCWILNSSYCLIKACFLSLFTSFVPSWVTSRISHNYRGTKTTKLDGGSP